MGAVSGLVEEYVASFWWLLNVSGESVKILDCRGFDFLKWEKMKVLNKTSLMGMSYINNVVIKDQPKSAGFHNGNVMASVGTRSTMDNNSHQIVHPVWVHSIVWLQFLYENEVNIYFQNYLLFTVLNSLSSSGNTTLWETLIWRLYCSMYLNLFKCNAKMVGNLLIRIRFCNRIPMITLVLK